MPDRWIEVFRAGDYGAKGKYGTADLDAIVANYDPVKHEAPLVLGPPEHDTPAYGWVERLKRSGETLLAKLRQVSPKLQGLIDANTFKKRSVSLYRNPLSLRYIGFLGTVPPEVKALAEVAFSEAAAETIEFTKKGRSEPSFHFNECAGLRAAPESIELAEAAQKLATEQKISFGEALPIARQQRSPARFNESPGLRADPESIELAEAAQKLAMEQGISFGEALPIAREQISAVRFNESAGLRADPESIALAEAARRLAIEQKISFGDALRIAR